jgi:MraZ protein
LNLRNYAGIEKDVSVIGVGSRIEIWASDKWESYNQNAAASYEDIAEKLIDLGI